MVIYFLKQTKIDFLDKKVITYGIAVKSDNKIIREIDDICLDKENNIYRVVLEDKINYVDVTNPINNSLEEDIKRRDFYIMLTYLLAECLILTSFALTYFGNPSVFIL